jgi:carbamoyl-phosphate synthase small subunit
VRYLEGFILLRDGTLIKGYATGQHGLYTGRLAHTHGIIDPQFVMTDPAFRGLFVLSDSPEIGSMGVRAGADQSDSLHSPGLVCRDIVDFPSYRGSFKSISQMLARGGSASISMDVEPLLSRDGQDAALLVIHGERMDMSLIGTMESALGRFSYETECSRMRSAKKVVHPNAGSNEHILVLDLGMRDGILRALRGRATVTTVSPSTPLSELPREFDRAVISSGPGSIPGPDLVEKVSEFLALCADRPVLSKGFGALAMNMALGGKPLRLVRAHRGTSIEVKVGQCLLPTYQNHELSLGPIDGFQGSCPAPDGSYEVLRSLRGPPRTMCTMDTLPEFGMTEDDPMLEFFEGGI